MANGNGGPAGTGLIPPGVGPGSQQQNPAPNPDPNPDDSGGEDPPELPPPGSEPEGQPQDIDGVPPVPADELDQHGNGGADGDDEEEIDPDEFRQEILDEVQRRFDRAVSRIQRTIQQQGQPPSSTGGQGDPDDEGGQQNPPPPVRRGRQVDTMSIRTYARGVLNDEMERMGRSERQAVRQVLDNVLEHTNWDTVDDEEEYVEGLVRSLTQTTQTLIKIGSDRKVAQLRSSGLLPQLATQPGSTAPVTHSTATGMAKGAEVAKRRFPGGRRRLTG